MAAPIPLLCPVSAANVRIPSKDGLGKQIRPSPTEHYTADCLVDPYEIGIGEPTHVGSATKAGHEPRDGSGLPARTRRTDVWSGTHDPPGPLNRL